MKTRKGFAAVPIFVLAFAVAQLFVLAGPAAASDVKIGHFQVELNGWYLNPPRWDPLQNDGYQATWFPYPQDFDLPTWWNEWWYNDPYLQPGDKWIQIQFSYAPINTTQPYDFHVTINWTNGGWVGKNGPPIGNQGYDPEQFIGRRTPYEFPKVVDPGGAFDSGQVWLHLGYNPEWVSVDVRGENVSIWGGILKHQCVPIPGAVWLLGSGLLGLLGLRRKFLR